MDVECDCKEFAIIGRGVAMQELNLVCPQSGCRFATPLTCNTRKAQLNSGKAADKFLFSLRDAEICKTCPGPVPIAEYKPKPKRDCYVDPPPSVAEETVKIEREKRPYVRGEPLMPYGLATFLPGEKRIFECPTYLNPRTLKSRLQREAHHAQVKFKFSLLSDGIRAERLPDGAITSKWRGPGQAPKRGIGSMGIGEIKIIEFEEGEAITTVKSQVAREINALPDRKYRTRLVNGSHALRIEREV